MLTRTMEVERECSGSAMIDVLKLIASLSPSFRKYNTTLRSMVPLPDPANRAGTVPIDEYPPGSEVMGLYPDTTSFYRAWVATPPSGGKVRALPILHSFFADHVLILPCHHQKKSAREAPVYQLRFEDDGDQVLGVHPDYVVEWPTF